MDTERHEKRSAAFLIVFCVIAIPIGGNLIFNTFRIYNSFFMNLRTRNFTRMVLSLNNTLETKQLSKVTNATPSMITRSRCTIILMPTEGRLGNKMFLFASAYGLARTHHCYLYIHQRGLDELTKVFQIKIPFLVTKSEVEGLQGIVRRETICAFFPDLLKPNAVQSLELVGYWQTYGYFIKYKDEIHQQFSFLPSILKVAGGYFNWLKSLTDACCLGYCSSVTHNTEICFRRWHKGLNSYNSDGTTSELKGALSKTNFTWIGVHVRRVGFYNGSVSDNTYIFKAMEYFSQKYHNTIFIVASDDKRYCERTFRHKRNIIVTPINLSPAEDMAILSLCQHTIVTAGTYGWWSGFLAGGDVMHDNRYMQKKSEISDCEPYIYFPPWFLFP